jgi:hypothetical protein
VIPSRVNRWPCSLTGQIAAIFQPAGVAEGGEGLQEFGDPGAGGAGEALSQVGGAEWAGAGGERGAQGLELLGQGLGPSGFGAAGGGRGGGDFCLGLDGGATAGVLELGAQPADEAATLLRRALGVQSDQALQDGLLRGRPALGGIEGTGGAVTGTGTSALGALAPKLRRGSEWRPASVTRGF